MVEKKGINDIRAIDKKTVVQYLNTVLARTSPRTRNNAGTSLNAIFTTMDDNEIIGDNFILKIKPLSTRPTLNKTFTPIQESNLEAYMKENDELLLSFVQFISLCFLRPIEVYMLKNKDIDIADKKIYVKAKNKKAKPKSFLKFYWNYCQTFPVPTLNIPYSRHMRLVARGMFLNGIKQIIIREGSRRSMIISV